MEGRVGKIESFVFFIVFFKISRGNKGKRLKFIIFDLVKLRVEVF